MCDRWDAGVGSTKLAAVLLESCSAAGDRQVSPHVLEILMNPFVSLQDRQWRYARRFLWIFLSSWGTALLFESESYEILSRMALVDKHKVKRQRLDRICEGKSMLQFLYKSWQMVTVEYVFFPCFLQHLDIKRSRSRTRSLVLSVGSKYSHTNVETLARDIPVTHSKVICSPVNRICV